jgi:hypothetical protein
MTSPDLRFRKGAPVAALALSVAAITGVTTPVVAAAPAFVDITWMSIANVFLEIGSLGLVIDGYFTRIPQSAFSGGGGGLAHTAQSFKPDVKAVSRVLDALGGTSRVNLLLTGHSHFDHSFDTATWSNLTGARIVGSKTTCLQAQAEKVPAERCQVVNGREVLSLAEGVTMRVVRWNHSGDPARNPEQHNPVELSAVPRPDASGGLRAGVADDFPNGGGARAFLFTVDGPDGRFSWFYQNSASEVDLHLPIVVDGVDYGAPIENLRSAMKEARLSSVDLWIGSGSAAVAKLVLPVLKPKAFLPVHWDGLYEPFEAGLPRPYVADPALEGLLGAEKVTLVRAGQYMDKWRLDRSGVRPMPNTAIKRTLGFADVQTFRR